MPGLRSNEGYLIAAALICISLPLLCEAYTKTPGRLKKIEVTGSNNLRLNSTYRRMLLPDSLDSSLYKSLRAYMGIRLDTLHGKDFSNIRKITAWVNKKWVHNPYGIAPVEANGMDILNAVDRGEKFSCLEYSKLLRDVLHANGYVARIVTLQSHEIDYSGPGTAHVAVEVYLSSQEKWIYIDPQWGIYLKSNDRLLNIYEYQKLVGTEKIHDVQIVNVHNNKPVTDREYSDYSEFIKQYLGFYSVDVIAEEERVHMLLALQGKKWPVTFQGLPRISQIYSEEHNDVYFDLNRTSMVLMYRPQSQALHSRNIEIYSVDDYMEKMPEFAAVPDFDIALHNNMPWFDHYEYRIDKGKWNSKKKNERIRWLLHRGGNDLQVRAVNSQGRYGPVTYISMNYNR